MLNEEPLQRRARPSLTPKPKKEQSKERQRNEQPCIPAAAWRPAALRPAAKRPKVATDAPRQEAKERSSDWSLGKRGAWMQTWRFRAGAEMAVQCGERNIFIAITTVGTPTLQARSHLFRRDNRLPGATIFALQRATLTLLASFIRLTMMTAMMTAVKLRDHRL